MAVVKPEEKRQLFERLANVREIVFGVQDGVLTTAGVLAGLSGAVSTRREVILAAAKVYVGVFETITGRDFALPDRAKPVLTRIRENLKKYF